MTDKQLHALVTAILMAGERANPERCGNLSHVSEMADIACEILEYSEGAMTL